MTQKKKTENTSVEINLDSLIATLKQNKEQHDTKGIEVETLQAEQDDLAITLDTTAKQLKVIHTFSTAEQQVHIDELDLDQFILSKPVRNRPRGRGNATCNIVLEIMEESENDLTNEDLHRAYLDTLDTDETGMDYTTFNIAIRPLTNDNKVVTRKFVEKGNSRTALMSLTTEQE